MMFDNFGIPAAAGIINFVVLTAALSSCNSGIFSTGRMLFNLAQQGEASPRFAKLGKTGVPSSAIVASSLALLIGVLLNYIVPEKSVHVGHQHCDIWSHLDMGDDLGGPNPFPQKLDSAGTREVNV